MNCRACDHPLSYHGDRAISACDGGLTIEHIKPGAMILRVQKEVPWAKCFCLGFDSY